MQQMLSFLLVKKLKNTASDQLCSGLKNWKLKKQIFENSVKSFLGCGFNTIPGPGLRIKKPTPNSIRSHF